MKKRKQKKLLVVTLAMLMAVIFNMNSIGTFADTLGAFDLLEGQTMPVLDEEVTTSTLGYSYNSLNGKENANNVILVSPRHGGFVTGMKARLEIEAQNASISTLTTFVNDIQIPSSWTSTLFAGKYHMDLPLTYKGLHKVEVRGTFNSKTVDILAVIDNRDHTYKYIAKKVVDCFMLQHPSTALEWDWGESVVLNSLIGLSRIVTPSEKTTYLNYVRDFHLHHEGRPAYKFNWADKVAASWSAWYLKQEPGYDSQNAGLGNLANAVEYYKIENRNRFGAINHLGDKRKPLLDMVGVLATYNNDSIWCDTMAMLTTGAARYSRDNLAAPGNADMYAFAKSQPQIYANKMRKSNGLYYHAWSVWTDAPFFIGNLPWLRGNGWVTANTADMLEIVGPNDDKWTEYSNLLKIQVEGLKKKQLPNGLWDTLVEIPGEGYDETSGSALIAYGIAKGVNLGVLPKSDLIVAQRVFNGIANRLTKTGAVNANLRQMTDISGPTDPKWKSYYIKRPKVDNRHYGVGSIVMLATQLTKAMAVVTPPAPAGTNLAPFGTATQNSTYSTAVASRAIDGNTDGDYYHNSVTHTAGSGTGDNWTLTLAAASKIKEIRIWNRTDGASDRLANYVIKLKDSNNNVVWEINPKIYPEPVSTFKFEDISAKYVYIESKYSNTPLSLAEVQVFGLPVVENVALRGTASQTSTSSSGDAKRAIDGNTDGWYTNNSVSHTGAEGYQDWIVDLGSYYSISEIKIWNRTDCCQDRLDNYSVRLLDQNQSAVWYSPQTTAPNPVTTLLPEGATARFVKIASLKVNTALSLAEVQVYGTPIVTMRKSNALTYAMSAEDFIVSPAAKLSNYNPSLSTQQFYEIDRGNGYYSFVKSGTNICLDGGTGGTNGQIVRFNQIVASNQDQHWKKVNLGNGYFRLEKRNSPGFSIDGNNGGSNGQTLYLWSSSDTNDNQRWLFSPYTFTSQQAESATLSGGAVANSIHAGYTGTGFVAGYNIVQGATTTFNVRVNDAGTYIANSRYAAGNGNSSNMGLYVNDIKIKDTTFDSTGSWATWAEKDEYVVLNAGMNTIAYKSEFTSPLCINLDRLTVRTAAPTPTPIPTATPVPTPLPSLGTNIALGGTATQTSDYSIYTANKAIDGNTDGDLNNNSVTHTLSSYDDNDSWTLDLGASKYITDMRIWNRTDAVSERLSNYGVTIYDANHNAVWESNQTSYPLPVTTINDIKVMGRYVEIFNNLAFTALSLAEVQVFGNTTAPTPTPIPVTPVGTNLALGGIASQTSDFEEYTASKAIDGNTDGAILNNSVAITNTSSDEKQTFALDLLSNVNVTDIRIWNRTDLAMDRLSNYTVLLLNENFATVWSSNESEYPNPVKTFNNVNKVGRYIQITNNKIDPITKMYTYLQLAEVQVFGSSTMTNLALTGTASQSSDFYGSVASRAIDGNTNGNWNYNSVTHTDYATNNWWSLDLGANKAISQIKIWNRTDAAPNRLTNYYVECYDSSWNYLWGSGTQATAPNPATTFILPAGINAKFVQVKHVNGDYLCLAEVQVFAPAPLTNLALTGTTWQNSTAVGGVSNRAIDGNTDGNWYNGSVTHTAGDRNEGDTFMIDLGSDKTISEIKMWNRTDYDMDRLDNYTIIISHTINGNTFTQTKTNYPNPSESINTNNASGRFITIISNKVYTPLHLAEVQVFGY